jgi:hypothetical protein
MNEAISELEKRWKEKGLNNEPLALHALITILIKERDCWLDNYKELNKAYNKLDLKLKELIRP